MAEKFLKRDNCINCGSNAVRTLSSGKYGDQPLREFIEKDPSGENPMPYLEDCVWEFVKCSECSQMYHRYIASPETDHLRFNVWTTREAIEEFEKGYYKPGRDFEKGRRYASHILRLHDMIGVDKPKILDFGCGWGTFITMCRCFGFDSFGVDKSTARRSGSSARVHATIGDVKKTDFHAVTMFEVLEHLDNPLEILGQLAELMVKDGILVLETPDCTGITDIIDHQSYLNIHPLDHINGFTPDTLESIAWRAGFRKVRQSVVHVTSSRAQILKKEARGLLQDTLKTTQLYFRKI